MTQLYRFVLTTNFVRTLRHPSIFAIGPSSGRRSGFGVVWMAPWCSWTDSSRPQVDLKDRPHLLVEAWLRRSEFGVVWMAPCTAGQIGVLDRFIRFIHWFLVTSGATSFTRFIYLWRPAQRRVLRVFYVVTYLLGCSSRLENRKGFCVINDATNTPQ